MPPPGPPLPDHRDPCVSSTERQPACWGGSGSRHVPVCLCLSAGLRPPHSPPVSPCVHTHLSDLLRPLLSPVTTPAASRPQWAAASSLPLPAVTAASCHPADATSFPLSCEARPSWGGRLAPSVLTRAGLRSSRFLLAFGEAPGPRLCVLPATSSARETESKAVECGH